MDLTWIDRNGGETLLTGGPLSVLEGVSGIDIASTVVEWDQRLSFDGSAPSGMREDVRPFVLPVAIEAADTQSVLASTISALKRGPGHLRAERGATVRTLRDVVFDQAVDVRDRMNDVDGFRRITAMFTAGDPWWYGSVESQFLTLGGATAFDAPIDFDDPLTPFDGGDTTTITVDPGSDSSASPFIVITGPFDDLTVTTGTQSLVLAAPLAAGQVMYVDGRPGARGPRMAGMDVNWSLLAPSSRVWQLSPGPNVVAVSSVGDTGASSVEVRWQPRYATP